LGKQVLQVFVRWDLLQGVEDDAQHLSLLYFLVNDTGINYFERVSGSKKPSASVEEYVELLEEEGAGSRG